MTDNEITNPAVSIIMPVYNAEAFLACAIDSILAQTFSSWELIAVDDCSSDTSAAILDAYAAKEPRIRVFRNAQNLRVGGTLDAAVAHARGNLIARMDADDVALPDRLALQVAFLGAHPDVVAVGGQAYRIDESGKRIGTKTFPCDPASLYDMMFLCVPILHPTLIVNRALIPNDFTWYEGWPCGEDSNLFFKLTQYGKTANIPEFILEYRYVPGGNLLKDPRATFMSTFRARRLALQKYGYQASVKARVINIFQLIAIHMIPNRYIPRVFSSLQRLMLMMGVSKTEIPTT